MLGLEGSLQGGTNRCGFYVSANQETATLMTDIFCPIRLMKSNAGTAYVVN